MGTRWLVALVSVVLSFGVACGDASPQSVALTEDHASSSAGAGVQAADAMAGNAARSDALAGATAGKNVSGSGGARASAATSGGAPATSGGAPATSGGAGTTTGGTGASGQAAPAAEGCSRTLLQTTIDAYFVALAAHDLSTLPLADTVKATENGKPIEPGKAGLWSSAGTLQHAHSALDSDACTAVAQAVVPDGNTPIPVALRLKLEAQKITEIETIAVRQGDYVLMSDTDALSASAQTVHWQDTVPPDQRNTREQLSAWMDKYFRMFPRGVCDTSSDCKRIENGGGSFECSAGASCASNAPGPNDRALTPRLILADVETGVGVGFTMFQSNTDMHIFKMYGGDVYGVSAILAKADSSGWD
jgi:hypothetical protein